MAVNRTDKNKALYSSEKPLYDQLENLRKLDPYHKMIIDQLIKTDRELRQNGQDN